MEIFRGGIISRHVFRERAQRSDAPALVGPLHRRATVSPGLALCVNHGQVRSTSSTSTSTTHGGRTRAHEPSHPRSHSRVSDVLVLTYIRARGGYLTNQSRMPRACFSSRAEPRPRPPRFSDRRGKKEAKRRVYRPAYRLDTQRRQGDFNLDRRINLPPCRELRSRNRNCL